MRSYRLIDQQTNKQKQTQLGSLIISRTRKDDRSSRSRKGWGVVWEKRRLAMAGEWVTAKKKRGSDRGGGERSTYPEGSHPEPSDSGRWREQGKSPSPRGDCGVGASRGPARVLLLVGLPGSGKSTFAKKLRANGWWVISQDALGTRDRCVTEFRKALQRGKSVVVDRCNHTRAQRQIWIAESVRATAGSTTGARVFALCFNTDARECRRRVLERRGHRTLSPQDEEVRPTRSTAEGAVEVELGLDHVRLRSSLRRGTPVPVGLRPCSIGG